MKPTLDANRFRAAWKKPPKPLVYVSVVPWGDYEKATPVADLKAAMALGKSSELAAFRIQIGKIALNAMMSNCNPRDYGSAFHGPHRVENFDPWGYPSIPILPEFFPWDAEPTGVRIVNPTDRTVCILHVGADYVPKRLREGSNPSDETPPPPPQRSGWIKRTWSRTLAKVNRLLLPYEYNSRDIRRIFDLK